MISSARTIQPLQGPLQGSICVPGDKSISHRVVLFAAMAQGTSRVSGLVDSNDVQSTIKAVFQLGAQVQLKKATDGSLEGTITGWGSAGPAQPAMPIDCGNSGTTARLLMGVLAPWDKTVTLIGDESLCRRPMKRVIDPLTLMGVTFEPQDAQSLPLTLTGSRNLQPLNFTMPVASAQVKSAVLLAGLGAWGTTTVHEPALSRNHTELMLPHFGVSCLTSLDTACVTGPAQLVATDIAVPGDPSSAAFLISAALLVPHSFITVEHMSLNPRRVGFLEVLKRMGAHLSCIQTDTVAGEPYGSVRVSYTHELFACEVTASEVPSLIDEIPVLSLIASHASGVSVFRGVSELRVKETDRISGIINGLTVLGIHAWTQGDDLFVQGSCDVAIPENAVLLSHQDHRLAMTWSLVGLCGDVPVTVTDADCFAVSYPGFISDMQRLVAL